MVNDRGILPTPSIKALVAANTGAFVEDFNHVFGVSNIHFFLDVLIGDGIILVIYRYMVVQLHGSSFPLREFIRILG